MSKSKGSDEYELEGFVDWRGRPARKDRHGGIHATFFVYVMQIFEILAFLAININLVTYFNGVMHMELSDAATMLTNFVGTTLLLSLVGGFVSDAYLNRFQTNFFSVCIELIGYAVLLIQAHYGSLKPPPCNLLDKSSVCEKVSGAKAVMLFVGLYLVAIGSGGVRGSLPPLGADQFDEKDPKERRKISTYFNMLFLSIAVGSSIGVTVVVWVMNNKGWDAGLGFCLAAVFMATLGIVAGKSTYRIRIPGGSPLTRIIQVFVAAFRNRKLSLPENPNDLYEVHDKEANIIHTEKLAHTNQFEFLDKAAILRGDSSKLENNMEPSGWRLCTVTQVEEAKILIRMVPIFASTILLSTGLAQLQTFSVSQGLTMDRSMGKHFKIPAPSLAIIPLLFLVILTPIYDRIFVPVARRFTGHEAGITHLQRVGVGLVLAVIAMCIAAVVEVKRKHVAKENGMLDSIPILMPPIPMSVFMLGFQFFLFGVADLFTLVGTMEFFYSEAPERMRSMSTAFSYASVSVGFFLSSVLVNAVNSATRNITESHGWLRGNNLNRNHLDLFYWLLAVLLLINFFNYLFWSTWYKHKKVAGIQEDKVSVGA
ncbi:hypothetical protein SUGI_0637420 [Cryptomeria japonica]|uniref:protein NRT1/ PTR FAMILY 4.5 n=1 Tax=Cryptomeria japonica TaxID=3369 RepID=UPI002414CD30|nr:protein NRT1/ PTR FAMILY 4.5 [Cryptomeria japonica]GLJ31709.1 hypothetical protein SUGI_0637420 [Cryptomeria japonica]